MAAETGYDAFISYSHVHDGVLAPRLQVKLERFAKPWYKMRALRAFCDTANLAANPQLWALNRPGVSGNAGAIQFAWRGALS